MVVASTSYREHPIKSK